MPEKRSYNQFRAMLSITKASLRSIFRSPSAVVFSFLFPLIFIVIFGFIGNSGFKLDLGIKQQSDTSNLLYRKITLNPTIRIITGERDQEMMQDLNKGRIDGILDIQPNPQGSSALFSVHVLTSASSRNTTLVLNTLQSMIDKGTLVMFVQEHPGTTSMAEIKEEKQPGREYR